MTAGTGHCPRVFGSTRKKRSANRLSLDHPRRETAQDFDAKGGFDVAQQVRNIKPTNPIPPKSRFGTRRRAARGSAVAETVDSGIGEGNRPGVQR